MSVSVPGTQTDKTAHFRAWFFHLRHIPRARRRSRAGTNVERTKLLRRLRSPAGVAAASASKRFRARNLPAAVASRAFPGGWTLSGGLGCLDLIGRERANMTPDAPAGGAGETVIAPQLSVRSGRAAVAFYQAAFGARELHRVGGVDGSEEVVAQLAVGDATFWVADESPANLNFSPESLGGSSVRMLLMVDDPERAVDRALQAGATLVYPVGEAHGWKLGRIVDPYGHHWEVGRPIR
jgi:PhnB protein